MLQTVQVKRPGCLLVSLNLKIRADGRVAAQLGKLTPLQRVSRRGLAPTSEVIISDLTHFL